ncbi:MAG: hypothetical protein QM742_17425 [Aquabacterium sp.]
MSRLEAEAARLYLPLANQAPDHTRALVLSLGRPAEWAPLAAVWQAVQAELGWPAPAIAVSGTDSYQLWFSLAEPVPIEEASAFLLALCNQHLAGVAPSRIDVMPGVTGLLPGKVMAPDQWSAFVAPDLAPMFAETPWLDLPPNADGQAELLSRVHSITPAAWQAATARLQRPSPPEAADGVAAQDVSSRLAGSCNRYADPRPFLLDVMNDPQVPLALRIEAAKALLPHLPPQR